MNVKTLQELNELSIEGIQNRISEATEELIVCQKLLEEKVNSK